MGDNECLAQVSESVTEAVGAVQRGGFCASSEPAALLVRNAFGQIYELFSQLLSIVAARCVVHI